MPARKDKPGKFGIGVLNSRERHLLDWWFVRNRSRSVWIDSSDTVFFSGGGFDSACGEVVRGLVSKGFLEAGTRSDADIVPEACTFYVLTFKGRKVCPNAPEGR